MIVSIVSTGLNGSNMTRLLKHGAAGHTVAIVDVSWIENPWARSSRCMATSTPPDLPFGLGAGDGTFTAVAAPAALAAGLAASWPLAAGFAGSCPLGAWLSAGAAATRAVTTDSAAIVSVARMSPSRLGKLRMIGVYVITGDPNNRSPSRQPLPRRSPGGPGRAAAPARAVREHRRQTLRQRYRWRGPVTSIGGSVRQSATRQPALHRSACSPPSAACKFYAAAARR